MADLKKKALKNIMRKRISPEELSDLGGLHFDPKKFKKMQRLRKKK